MGLPESLPEYSHPDISPEGIVKQVDDAKKLVAKARAILKGQQGDEDKPSKTQAEHIDGSHDISPYADGEVTAKMLKESGEGEWVS